MEKKITQLSKNYNDKFNEYILDFRKKADNNAYDVFYPSFGMHNYKNCDFLFYGQSIKGWSPTIANYSDKRQEKFIRDCIEYSNNYVNGDTPLDWINVYWSGKTYKENVVTRQKKVFYGDMKYKTHRSLFWNVVYKLVNAYEEIVDEESFEWSKSVVWSNLYKIAPSRRVNPNVKERDWQWPIAADLVQMELKEIQPKFCIVLTNYSWWKDFAEKLELPNDKHKKSNIIEAVQKYNDTKIIITKRPFTANTYQFVEELREVIGSRKNPALFRQYL